jgi:hypothetical protein
MNIQMGTHSIVFDHMGAITGVILAPVVNVSFPAICLLTEVLVPTNGAFALATIPNPFVLHRDTISMP